MADPVLVKLIVTKFSSNTVFLPFALSFSGARSCYPPLTLAEASNREVAGPVLLNIIFGFFFWHGLSFNWLKVLWSQVLLHSALHEAGGRRSPSPRGSPSGRWKWLYFFPHCGGCSRISGSGLQLALVEIEQRLEQLTGLEVPLVFGIQEGGKRLLSRVFHIPLK